MSVGTPGNAQALGPRSIAIGDSDTGLKQRSDGVLDVYTDSISVSTFTPSGFRTSRVVNVETPDGDTRGVYVSPARNGGSNALIAGPVQGVDYWEGWRDTATGMLVEFPRQGMIAGIWKATHWGTNHVAAMQVYYPSDGSAWVTRLVTGGASWYFSGDGVASGQQWVSTSDIRLKSNIEPIKGALDKLKQIKGYTYDKKNSLSEDDENVFTTHEAGLIAQEVQEVLPEAVVETSEDKLLAVNSYAVQALQINAIKELDVKVEAQAETIAVLSTQIENQQQQIDELKALVQQLLNK
ncbi:tail fiber domain-containing protein [Escherichia coli]|uniref:tail fiber domain-containing protein n=2 Tax=Enterobacteriaceae TaxID=543 RepID=UPI0012611B43|nr:tail fiber domain-containing protein [Escherichia coli]